MRLADKILIFIDHCLPEIGFKFPYQKMAKVFGCSVTTLRKEFSNLKRSGFIAHKTRYRRKIPILTRKGKLQIAPSLPYKKYGQWDKKWRIVIFEIPEKERKCRTILCEKLEDLGFQKIQRGVYISPHPLLGTVSRLSTELGIRQYLTAVEADKIEKEERTIQKIWEIKKINQEYQDFIKRARSTPKRKFWPLLAKQFEQQFYEIYQKDPHLPEELLPKDWKGKAAYEVYKEIINSY